MNETKPQPMFERHRDLEDRTDGPDVLSAIEASEKGAAPLVGTGELVLLRLSSAKDFISEIESEISRNEIFRHEHEKRGRIAESNRCGAVIAALERVLENFQRLTGVATVCQPQENVKAQTGGPLK